MLHAESLNVVACAPVTSASWNVQPALKFVVCRRDEPELLLDELPFELLLDGPAPEELLLLEDRAVDELARVPEVLDELTAVTELLDEPPAAPELLDELAAVPEVPELLDELTEGTELVDAPPAVPELVDELTAVTGLVRELPELPEAPSEVPDVALLRDTLTEVPALPPKPPGPRGLDPDPPPQAAVSPKQTAKAVAQRRYESIQSSGRLRSDGAAQRAPRGFAPVLLQVGGAKISGDEADAQCEGALLNTHSSKRDRLRT